MRRVGCLSSARRAECNPGRAAATEGDVRERRPPVSAGLSVTDRLVPCTPLCLPISTSCRTLSNQRLSPTVPFTYRWMQPPRMTEKGRPGFWLWKMTDTLARGGEER